MFIYLELGARITIRNFMMVEGVKGIPFRRYRNSARGIDGNEYLDDLGQTMPFEEFYGKIATGAMPLTSQVNVEQFHALKQ